MALRASFYLLLTRLLYENLDRLLYISRQMRTPRPVHTPSPLRNVQYPPPSPPSPPKWTLPPLPPPSTSSSFEPPSTPPQSIIPSTPPPAPSLTITIYEHISIPPTPPSLSAHLSERINLMTSTLQHHLTALDTTAFLLRMDSTSAPALDNDQTITESHASEIGNKCVARVEEEERSDSLLDLLPFLLRKARANIDALQRLLLEAVGGM